MANQETYQIAHDPKIKDTKSKREAVNHEYTDSEQKEKEKIAHYIERKTYYAQSRQSKEKEWTESFKMYNSWIDTTRNPFLSNLFIPKVHEATELLSAWLIGSNQSIKTSPENNGDTYKAQASGKWLDFLWRKVLKARVKILTWIKQGVVFGNGILKVGWDYEKNQPFMVNTAIEDVFFDYYQPDIQDSELVIHEVRRSQDSVKEDESFIKEVREDCIVGSDNSPYSDDVSYKFSNYDGSLTHSAANGKVPILEVHDTVHDTICSIIPTSNGWRIAKEVSKKENIHFYNDGKDKKVYFAPFIKLRFKTSPLSNRAYDVGAIFPTVKIQKSFNELFNQYFDNVVMINNPMWIKRRGARINPMELVRRAGGVITVKDIDKDLKPETVSDVKQSIIEMLGRLDSEFQQASMVVNLLKGIESGSGNTATEIQLGQQNVQTLLDMIDENINDALSEAGNMVLALSLQNYEGNHTLKMFENDSAIGVLDFKPGDLIGMYDVKVSADRSAGTSKVVRQKQLLDFVSILLKNPEILGRYPNLMRKSLERWLEDAGFQDTQFFFDEGTPIKTDQPQPKQEAGGG